MQYESEYSRRWSASASASQGSRLDARVSKESISNRVRVQATDRGCKQHKSTRVSEMETKSVSVSESELQQLTKLLKCFATLHILFYSTRTVTLNKTYWL